MPAKHQRTTFFSSLSYNMALWLTKPARCTRGLLFWIDKLHLCSQCLFLQRLQLPACSLHTDGCTCVIKDRQKYTSFQYEPHFIHGLHLQRSKNARNGDLILNEQTEWRKGTRLKHILGQIDRRFGKVTPWNSLVLGAPCPPPLLSLPQGRVIVPAYQCHLDRAWGK